MGKKMDEKRKLSPGDVTEARVTPPERRQIQKVIGFERKQEAWDLVSKNGLTIGEAARRMGISDVTVRRYLYEIMEDAKIHLFEDIERWKLEQHHRYNHIYAEAIGAWEGSKADHKRQTSKINPRRGPDGQARKGEIPSEVKVTTETSPGDPRYLTAAITALGAQAKLWGLNAPEQSEINSRSLVAVTNVSENEMSAIRAAEEAFKRNRYGEKHGRTDDPRTLEVPGVVVSTVRQDQPPDEGEDSL